MQMVTAIYTTMIFTHTAMSLPVMAVCMVVGSMLLSATLPIGESIAQVRFRRLQRTTTRSSSGSHTGLVWFRTVPVGLYVCRMG
jgi:hypothetical protein